MKFAKPPLTLAAQAKLLLERGLMGDESEIVAKLGSVSYYRLSGYWFPFRNPDDTFRPGTRFELVWHQYRFDRRLRVLTMDAIERVEIALRSRIVYELALRYGAFAHMDIRNFPGWNQNDFDDFHRRLNSELEKSHEAFIEHFQVKYGDEHPSPPIWMVGELFTFGCAFSLFRGIHPDIRDLLASQYGVTVKVLLSWLRSINAVRNICAHHGRLFSRVIGVKPLIPERDPRWRVFDPLPKDRIFCTLSILRQMLRSDAPSSRWAERFESLLREFPQIPLRIMGMPADWKSLEIWRL